MSKKPRKALQIDVLREDAPAYQVNGHGAAHKPTFIDLFAGAGGLSFGLVEAGFRCVYAVESDLWASQSFRQNHSEVLVASTDIRKISDVDIRSLALGKIDLVVGGPPCQGFSHSNTVNRDPHDPRNSLFIDFLRFVSTIEPAVALIENVPGLLSTRLTGGALVIQVIADEFARIGYETHYEILDASRYGVPQRRPRLFIIALRSDQSPTGIVFPSPTHAELALNELELPGLRSRMLPAVTLWDAISDLPQLDSDNPVDELTYTSPPSNDFQQLMRRDAPQLISHHEPMRHTARIVERFKHIGYGQSEEDVPEHLRPRKRGNPKASSGQTYSQNSRRQNPDRPCNTVVASAHTNFIHPYLHRNFTVREAMRIQSFPDRFTLKGKRAVLSKSLSMRKGYTDDVYLDQRMQIGNAVPTLLATAVGRHLKKVIPSFSCHELASA